MTAAKKPFTVSSDPVRKKDLQAIHAMKRELGLVEDDYRAIVRRASGDRCDSSADLTASERGRLLDALRRLGGGKGRLSRFREDTQYFKARAIWRALGKADKLRDGSDKALDAYIKGQVGNQDLGALDARAWRAVIEGLKGWAAREGVELAP